AARRPPVLPPRKRAALAALRRSHARLAAAGDAFFPGAVPALPHRRTAAQPSEQEAAILAAPGPIAQSGYNDNVIRFLLPAVFALAAALPAQNAFFPLKDLKPGMRGSGRTVFQGNQVEEFQVEILGVIENVGPKESLILARLSGGPLEHTGVMQGMSGSPVYIDGKLVGAVAMAFPFAKDPIAGIRPIQDMVRGAAAPSPPAATPVQVQRAAVAFGEKDLTRHIPKPSSGQGGDPRLVDIA